MKEQAFTQKKKLHQMKAKANVFLPADKPTDGRKNNGGVREGSGRKSQNKINMTFSINEDVATAAKDKHKGELSSKVEKFLKRIAK